MIEKADRPHTTSRSSVAPPVSSLPFGGQIGGYVLLEPVGAGTWTQVYRAIRREDRQECAVKLLHPGAPHAARLRATGFRLPAPGVRGPRPEASAPAGPALASEPSGIETDGRWSRAWHLIEREAVVGQRVQHPNLVRIEAAHVQRPPYFLVMEWIDGWGLDRWIRALGRLEVPLALWIARQVAEALDALHQAGFVHGDVKPANILVTRRGKAKLIDLGLARRVRWPRTNASMRLSDAAGSTDQPTATFIAGTAYYMAPELTIATPAGDIRSDLYSLGVTLYEMLSGERPFPHSDIAGALRQHRQELPRPLRRLVPLVPRSVAVLVHRLLAKEPLRRPQSPEELIGLLAREEIETLDYRPSA